MRMRIVDCADGLRALRPEWEALLADSDSDALSVTPPWIEAWWRTYGTGDRRLHVAVVCDAEGELLAIAPAMKAPARFRGVPITKLALMVNGYTPSSGIVVRRGADVSAIVKLILRDFTAEPGVDVVELTRIDTNGNLRGSAVEHLRTAGQQFGEAPDIDTPFISLASDWATLMAGLSPRFRKEVRARLRKVSGPGGLEAKRFRVTDRSHPAIARMVEISSRSWKHDTGADLGADSDGKEFLSSLCDVFGPSGQVVVWELLKDGTPIAFEFHVTHARTTYPLRADFRADFAYLSPGAVLEAYVLRSLFDDRDTLEYNTCANAYDYLLRWTSTTRKHTTLQVFPRRVLPTALHAFEYGVVPILRPVRSWMRSTAGKHPRSRGNRRAGLRSIKQWPDGRSRRSRSLVNGGGAAAGNGRPSPARRGLLYGSDVARDLISIARRQWAFVNVRPTTATIFLTYRCNSRCATCTLWKRSHAEEISREMGFAEWERILCQLHDFGVRSIEIFGGNVLLRKKLLIDVLHLLNDMGFTIHFPTNQLGLDDEVGKAIVSCVNSVYISTDGVGDHQDLIRGIEGAAQIAEAAVARLRRLRGGNGPSPRLVCNTTVSRHNSSILSSLTRYAVDHGFDEIHFEYAGEHTPEHIRDSVIDGLVPTPYYVRQGDESILVDAEGARELKRTLRQIRRKYAHAPIVIKSTNIDILSEEHLSRGTIPHRKCYVERLEVTVDPSGDLVACPFINNYRMGNLLEQPLSDVWNNDRHRRFRKLQNSGELRMCRHCILGVERNPGIWTSLRRAHLSRIVPLADRLRRRDSHGS